MNEDVGYSQNWIPVEGSFASCCGESQTIDDSVCSSTDNIPLLDLSDSEYKTNMFDSIFSNSNSSLFDGTMTDTFSSQNSMISSPESPGMFLAEYKKSPEQTYNLSFKQYFTDDCSLEQMYDDLDSDMAILTAREDD